ncbi:hypothetical protein NEIRO02_1306 [Nematocida sp. AWRm79]|nr:hypothetical protein NEIRO02_1306 [Nematocida sp. AWRm79]
MAISLQSILDSLNINKICELVRSWVNIFVNLVMFCLAKFSGLINKFFLEPRNNVFE